MKEENKTIIRALNKYGRVPQQYELLNEIDRLETIIDEIEYYVLNEYYFDDVGMKIIDRSKLQDKIQELKVENLDYLKSKGE